MINNDQLFFSVGVTLLFLVSSYLLGHFLVKCTAKVMGKTNAEIDAFWKLLIGLLLAISLFAIYKTKGISILSPLPVLLICFVGQKLKTINIIPKGYTVVGFIALSVLFYLGFYYWVLQSFDSDTVKYISGDFNIYFRIAEQVSTSGIENNSLDLIFPVSKAAPYHFGDIWLYAFIAQMVHHHPSVVFFVSFSVLTTVFVTGMYTYMADRFQQYLSGRNYYLYLVLFSGLFTGFAVFFPKFILIADVYTFSIANWGKIIIQSCFFIGLIKLVRQKEYWSFALLTIIAGLTFINTLPALFTAAFLWLTIAAISKKINWKSWLQLHVFYVGVTGIYVIFLYYFIPKLFSIRVDSYTVPANNSPALSLAKSAKTAVSIFVGGWFQLFTLLPYFIILFACFILLKLKAKNVIRNIAEDDFLFVILMFISGLFCWSILNSVVADSIQFFSNILPAVYTLFISLLLMFVIYIVRNKLLIVATVLLVGIGAVINNRSFFCVNYFDKQEWEKLSSFCKNEDNSKFVNLQSGSHFSTFFSKNTNFYIPLPILNYQWPEYSNFSLNAPFIPADEQNVYVWEERKMLSSAPFTRYYSDKKDRMSVDETILSFVQEKNIAFVSVSLDSTLPLSLRPIISDSILLKKSGSIVYRLNRDM